MLLQLRSRVLGLRLDGVRCLLEDMFTHGANLWRKSIRVSSKVAKVTRGTPEPLLHIFESWPIYFEKPKHKSSKS